MEREETDREKVRTFWSERAGPHSGASRPETQVTFENDARLLALRAGIESELIRTKLPLGKNDVVVDLGAGNGRFSLFFAPNVSRVVAVELTEGFSSSIRRQAETSNIDNIEVLTAPAESFCRENFADVVFMSMLMHYLDADQYRRTVANISKTLKRDGVLFFFETVSVLKDEFFVDKFSEELNADYTSLYRTPGQFIKDLGELGFRLEEFAPVFEDGSELNKRVETRLYYFIFRPPGRPV
jgi:cyclopropane fatty-acyl-phospholipid synthase-like methyltransferase